MRRREQLSVEGEELDSEKRVSETVLIYIEAHLSKFLVDSTWQQAY